jgi:hypothetical protein
MPAGKVCGAKFVFDVSCFTLEVLAKFRLKVCT